MKVLVIEDDSELVELISIALEIGWPDTQMISTHLGEKGAELVETEKPDIVLLDLGLPDISGFEVLKQIRAFSEVPVVIETVRKSEGDVVKGFGLGANEYIVKPFGQLELMARIKNVLRKYPSDTSSGVLTCGKLCLDVTHGKLTKGSNSIKLTPTETLLMRALMNNEGKIQTFSELSDIIWGDDYLASNGPLRVYIHRLRRKIETVSEHTVKIISLPGIGFSLEVAK